MRPDFSKRNGLLPVIVQDRESKKVLMLGYSDEAALQKTLSTRMATFWSTSRQSLWTKGETSGDYLYVHEVWIDCDQDALLYLVEMQGQGVCHTRNAAGLARRSCFYRAYDFEKRQLNHHDPLPKNEAED